MPSDRTKPAAPVERDGGFCRYQALIAMTIHLKTPLTCQI
jgi:hypothetical protein